MPVNKTDVHDIHARDGIPVFSSYGKVIVQPSPVESSSRSYYCAMGAN